MGWIPISCLISWVDRKRADQDAKDWEWRRQDELIHPEDKRRIIHMRVPKRNLTAEKATPEHRSDLIHRNTVSHQSAIVVTEESFSYRDTKKMIYSKLVSNPFEHD